MILHKRAGGEEREKGTYPYEPHHEDEHFEHGENGARLGGVIRPDDRLE